jgi:ketosteroid isomerase-like protein
MNDDALRADLLRWFDQFAECVRAQDIEGASHLFDDQVLGFGTRNEMLIGLEALRESQWRPTWAETRDFRFLPETIHTDICSSGERAWASCLWTSCGDPGDRPAFPRRGRATFIFVEDGGWRCIHSHLSMTPTGDL